MKGNTLAEFISDLLISGGPEKEFEYRGNKYFIESQLYESDPTQVEFVIFECFGDQNYIFRCHGKNNEMCVSEFEKAKIFNGRTIYEAHDEITVLYG